MLTQKKFLSALSLALFTSQVFCAVEVLFEFKGGAFLPTGTCFKNIYGKSGALYGPEISLQLWEDAPLYAFASAQYFSKKGYSIGLCCPTTAQIVPLDFGLKYMTPLKFGSVYIGLGLEAAHLKTTNCSPYVLPETARWGVGGIAKFGAYVNLPRHFAFDLFFNYSFVKLRPDNCCSPCDTSKVDISGITLGAGLSYQC